MPDTHAQEAGAQQRLNKQIPQRRGLVSLAHRGSGNKEGAHAAGADPAAAALYWASESSAVKGGAVPTPTHPFWLLLDASSCPWLYPSPQRRRGTRLPALTLLPWENTLHLVISHLIRGLP